MIHQQSEPRSRRSLFPYCTSRDCPEEFLKAMQPTLQRFPEELGVQSSVTKAAEKIFSESGWEGCFSIATSSEKTILEIRHKKARAPFQSFTDVYGEMDEEDFEIDLEETVPSTVSYQKNYMMGGTQYTFIWLYQ